MKPRSHLDLSATAERRAQELGEPIRLEKTVGRVRKSASRQKQESAALTRRERRVKDILLKELKKMQGWPGLSYVEKKNLEERLNVEYIDRELAKMRKQLRWLPKLLAVLGIIFAVQFGVFLWEAMATGMSVIDGTFFGPLIAGLLFIGPVAFYPLIPMIQMRSLKRRIWIFEALRELSDADEMDVMLGRVVEEADALIQRIVDQEMGLAPKIALPDSEPEPTHASEQRIRRPNKT